MIIQAATILAATVWDVVAYPIASLIGSAIVYGLIMTGAKLIQWLKHRAA